MTARLASPAALAGGALVFLGIVNELTATLLLGPNGTRTLTTQFWTHVNDLDYAQAAPYALLMVLLSMPMVSRALPRLAGVDRPWLTSSSTASRSAFGDVARPRRRSTSASSDGRRWRSSVRRGCGKTTILRLIAGFERPDAGIDRDRRDDRCSGADVGAAAPAGDRLRARRTARCSRI